MLGRTLFRLFWNTYDSLGTWLLIGAVALVAGAPLVTAPAVWGAVLASAARAECEQGFDLATFCEDFKLYFKRSSLLGLCLAVGVVLCLGNIVFYGRPSLNDVVPAIVRMGLIGFFIWIGVFGFAGLQVAWAFMVFQDLRPLKALKRGFIVIVTYPISSFIVFMIGMILCVGLIMTIVGVILLPGVLANLNMGLVGGALEQVEEEEDRQLRRRIEKEGLSSREQVQALDEREAARRRRYDRGWRDIFRPWEMR